MSRRMSLGVGRPLPLADSSNNRAGGGVLRRGGEPSPAVKPRRTHARGETAPPGGTVSKRSRIDADPPAPKTTVLLSVGADPSPLDGLSAVERVRMRRMMQTQGMMQMMMQQQQQQQQFMEEPSHPHNTSFEQDSSYDAGSTTMSLRGGLPPASAAHAGRRQSIAVFSVARADGSVAGYSLSQGSAGTQQLPQSLSQLTADSERGEGAALDPVEGAGLRSSNRQLQLRVEQLEREKMELRMSKAPLEARFRQEQEAWEREQARLFQEIDQLTLARSEAENRYRDLEMKHEAMEAEMRQLRHELRQASSRAPTGGFNVATSGGSVWKQAQLQSEKEVIELKEEVQELRLNNVSIEKELHATKIQLESTLRQYEELAQEYESVAESSNTNRDAEIQLEVLTTEHIAASAQLNAVCADLAATKARSDATIEALEARYKAEIEQLQFEISVLRTRAGRGDISLDPSMAMDEEDEAVLRAKIKEKDRKIKELEQEIIRGEQIRRQMHNRIQELRGNIRVFVRCRPFLPSDQQTADATIIVSPDGESLAITDPRSENHCDFKFDKVFPPSSGQDHVFQEVSDFVQSALDGYQVCLFSYGQTGSGKTHTMQGSGVGAMRGIIPRAVEQILTQANKMHSQKWDFTLSASFLEIYNENLRDLLYTMDDKSKGEPPKLAIKRNRAGKSFVENLTELPIETVDSVRGMNQLETLMSVAARARSVACTKMNAQSSRSHSVFMLHIRGRNDKSGTEVQGSLNLCDLAGSERLDRSGAANDAKRLKETQSINKSLSCLGDVFNALAQRASHVPFRNSKLTYLLQDCLSGDGKALMFVNLSPTAESSGESLCSLRFAQRVNQVELGKPTKNIQYNHNH